MTVASRRREYGMNIASDNTAIVFVSPLLRSSRVEFRLHHKIYQLQELLATRCIKEKIKIVYVSHVDHELSMRHVPVYRQ